jgi:YD repeat-containing protein
VKFKIGLFSTFSLANRWENRTVPISRPSHVRGRLVPLSVVFVGALFALVLLGSGSAQAAVVCPNPVPVVNENQCHGESGTSEWEVWDYSQELGGFPTKTSVNLGESVTLKIGRNGPVSPTKTVNISVYRMGYYEGTGGRLVNSASKVAINNTFECNPMDPTTGEVNCNNWAATYTIPASAFPASGVYIAKLVASTGDETQIVFTVRDDSRQPSAEVLYVLPTATYEAYNTFGGKSLYYGTEGGNTVSGTSRAVKVSFQRPLAQAGAHLNWFTGPDIDLLEWLEKQGYNVAYTDDVQLQSHPQELLNHDVDVISGHSEYWSEGQFKAFLAAREAGVNIASFSANTAYWKVRYEDNNNTLVCYKTVEGSGSTGNGSVSENDWGPDGIKGTADDALGPDGKAGTADDNPQNATTTFRDNGAPPGDPSAPPGGRVGPDMPENELFGVMYVGDNDEQDYPITVPPGNANEEFASSRVWRNTGISENSTTKIGENLVGWEWDAIPTQPQYLKHEPKGVKSIYATNVQVSKTNSWIQDEGRLRNTEPPPGQPGTIGGAEYTAESGAEVFASGTMQWAYGLTSFADERIQQATYNVFSDMGVQPNTPEEGLHLDPAGANRPPNGGFTISQNPAKTNTSITFDGSASHDPDGTIAKYEWDLDGNGTFETNSGSKATVTHSYTAEGEYTVRLRVTDNNGATDTAVRTLTIINNLPPTASFTATPSVVKEGEPISFSGAGSSDPDGTIAKYEWDFDGNGTYETNGGSNPVISHSYTTPGTYTVGLRVTDNGGKTATTTRPISVNSGEVSKYSDSVLATAGLAHYWRMGETSGTTLADSAGSSPATTFGEPTLGVPGGVSNDPDHAVEFDGVNDAAKAAIDLSGTHAVTVEFWLKWDNYANDDRLAMEFTNNFNESPGGFIVDPDAPQFGGTFGVGIGSGNARNTVYFERPSAGQWHHYAFVLDTSAPAAQQITPYVDGKTIAYEKGDSGTGGGNFANSTLNFMSRSANSLFGAGVLDEVAIYRRTLGPTTIADHYNAIVPTGGGEGGPEGGAGEGGGKEETGGGKEETSGTGGEGPATYSKSVLGTSTLLHYWRMGEASGPTLADSKGTSTATATGGPTFGVPGSLKGDPNTAVRFDGVDDAASAPLNLAGKSAVTVEFWLKWNSYANDDRLAMEFTNNFNEAAGGFIVDPDAPQNGGTFGVGIGQGASRNNVFFARPTAGQWHHYAFVLDTSAPAAQQITPYVDGKAIAYTKLDSGTGAGSFANSTLNLMSRAGSSLFGSGELDEVSVFGSALSSTTVEDNFKGIVPEGGGSEGGKEEEKEEGTSTPATYSESVLGTPGLTDYWRLGESSGSVFADSVGPSPAAIAGEPTLGVTGAISGDADKAARFDGINDSASAAVDLSGKSAITVEFWLKWNSYANNDALAMEFTNNFNETPGGFLIDPNSSYGSFAVGIGSGASRNTTLFARPTAGQWHHYAFVLNTTAPAAEEVVPYVDGEAVSYSKPESGSGAPTFANSTLNFMSRAGTGLFGAGDLDEVAIYGRALDAKTIANHFHGVVTNKRPVASFSAPNTAQAGQVVSFDASASSDAEGPIAKYEWDLDGDGTYETNTGTTPTVSHTYSSNGPVQVGLRVTDGSGSTATTSHTLTVEGETSGGPTSYSEAVTGTPGLRDYWRMGESSGSVLADSVGLNPATTSGEPTLGVPGSVFGDPDTAVRFDGVNDSASAPVNLSSASTITVEFWLKWNSYANDDRLAMEFTNNFNETPGGFLVDPNSSYGSFAVGIGQGASRNVTLFPRPSAGLWHHYALVLDPTAPAAQEVVPYVDGEAVSFTKAESGTGAGNFANATLNFMSRAGTDLFGAGDLDEVAIYDRALSQATIASHYKLAAHNVPPEASFTATPNPAPTNTSVTFDASGSTDVDGTVAKYEWDLDGNGTYETSTGTTPTVTRSYSIPGDRSIGLRVTDNKGATGTTTRTVTIQNQLPIASFTSTPNPVLSGVSVSFNAAASKDPDGTIAKYEWDLDGNGTYETDTGTTSTASASYPTPGNRTIGLRVTDNSGETATSSRTLVVENRAPTVSFTVTPNPVLSGVSTTFDASASVDPDGTIAKYEWDLDGNGTYETNTGTKATVSNTFATPGEKTVGLRVTDNKGATATTTRTVTVQNRAPSASFTATPNPVVSGSNITFDASGSKDPDGTITEYAWDIDGNGAADITGETKPTVTVSYAKPGTYAVKLLVKDNENATATATVTVTVQNRAPNASFTATPNPVSPNATTTFDASASNDPDGTIAKYEWDLDGNGTYETNTGTKATTTRSYTTEGTVNVGLRITDNSGATSTTTVPVVVKNQAPTASFTATPNPANTNATVSFNAGASVDPDGTIAKYEWDLDGNGTYETNTGTTKTTSKAYATPGEVTVGLRVTDNKGATSTTTKVITIQNQLPVPSFTVTPNPTTAGSTVTFNGSASKDPDGTIAKYEWDLNGDGTYETNTGTTATTSFKYATATEPVVGLRVTDNRGATATTTKTLVVRGPYNNAVIGTSGLIDYWRLGELSGTNLNDVVGGNDATALNGVTLGTAGNLTLDPDTAATFDGTNDAATAPLNLSSTSKLTLEFWLKWTSYANDDKLAFEFTPNFNNTSGGFLINPDSSTSGGQFEVAMGRSTTRNSIFFPRPSAGVWHHYAIVFNAATLSPSITPYVDGKAVSFSKGTSSLGGGNFANSTLYFMSRNASSLFGKGSLDEVALYNQNLTATQIAQHFAAR